MEVIGVGQELRHRHILDGYRVMRGIGNDGIGAAIRRVGGGQYAGYGLEQGVVELNAVARHVEVCDCRVAKPGLENKDIVSGSASEQGMKRICNYNARRRC